MKMCQKHWDLCRAAIDSHGLAPLVAANGQEACNKMMAEMEGAPTRENFDPLLSMNNHWWATALQCGGLYLMGQNQDGSNDGHYCPLCELDSHYKEFVPEAEVNMVADQMLEWVKKEGLLPKAN
jgi:hypothetical protein